MTDSLTARVRWVEGHRFVATTGSGHALVLDNPHREDGAAVSPMELLLVSLAGCTGVDVVAILERMRQPLEGLDVEVVGFRRGEHPRVFATIEVVYRLRGAGLDPRKVLRAVSLSEEKYCSVSAMLGSTARLEVRVELEGRRITAE